MHNKLQEIYKFLSENREFNHEIQEKFYKTVVLPYETPSEKILSLLYNVANTQSQPKIDCLSSFYKKIFEDTKSLYSLENFLNKINPNQPLNFNSLYNGMRIQNGWGKKTSALFSRCIYHLHNGQYCEDLKIWHDVPKTFPDNDNFYLPVDAVISSIFKKLDNSQKWDFDKINNFLKQKYTSIDIEVWDDLWFWGFITQKGTGKNRDFEWNENKYWVMKDSNKSIEIVDIVRSKALEFNGLLTINK